MPLACRYSTVRRRRTHAFFALTVLTTAALCACGAVPFLQSDPRAPRDRASRFDRFVAELDLALMDTSPILERARRAESADDLAHVEWSEARRRAVRRTVVESALRRLEREFAPGRLDEDRAIVSRVLQDDLARLADTERRRPAEASGTTLADLARTPWEGVLVEAPSILAREHPRTSAEDLESWIAMLEAIVETSGTVLTPASRTAGDERFGAASAPSIATPRVVVDRALTFAIRLAASAGADGAQDPIFGPLLVATGGVRGRGARRIEDASRRAIERSVAETYRDLATRLRETLEALEEGERRGPLEGEAREAWLGGLVEVSGAETTPIRLQTLVRRELERTAVETAGVVDPFAEDMDAARTVFRDLRDGEIDFPAGAMPVRPPELLWNEAESELERFVSGLPPLALRSVPAAFYERPNGRWSPFVRGNLAPVDDPRARPCLYLEMPEQLPEWLREAEAWRYGVPGRAVLDAFRRSATETPRILRATQREAFEEGWGLYAVGAGVDAGVILEVDEGFSRLAQELIAFASLLVDLGLHEDGWSRRQAIDFLLEVTPLSAEQANEVALRGLAHPGRLALPAIGLLRLRALRRGVEGALGDAFDPAEFHRALLRGGPIPLSEMDLRMERWLASREEGTSRS